MSAQTAVSTAGRSPQFGDLIPIVWIGFLAGTLDITENLVSNQFRGVNAKMVFQYIASGLIGARSFQLGAISIALGVIIHYAIAYFWTTAYYALSRKRSILLRRPVISGLLYGVVVYLIMNFVVLPLSGVPHPHKPVTIASRISDVLALMFCIGLTISLLIRRMSARRLNNI